MCVDALSLGSSSFVLLATVAVFGTLEPDSAKVAWATIVTVAEAPSATLPSAQLTVGDTNEQLPCDEVDETCVMPAGSPSATTTFAALDGPPLATFSVYMTCPPAATLCAAVLTIDTSAVGPTSTFVESELSDGSGSGLSDDTVAVLICVPLAVAVTVMVAVALAPSAIEPRSQLTVPALFAQPAEAE